MDNHNKESESPTFEKIDFMKHLLIFILIPVTVFSQPTSVELSNIMTEWLDENDNPAIVGCIVKGNEIIWMDAFGMANIEEEYEATVDTPFMLASVSKTYTGMALVKAVNDAPGVSLNDPVSDHLSFWVQHPDFPQTDITIWQLLTHTSGIDDNWDVMPYCAGDCTVALGDFLFGYFTPGQDDYDPNANFQNSEPGYSYSYSNIGAALCGHLVETITGEAFNTYCETHLFEPLCMENTHWFLSEFDDINEIAVPYDTWGNGAAINHYGYPDYPDGQLRSSIRDVANWLLMAANDGHFAGVDVLAPLLIDNAMSPHFNNDQGLIWYSESLDSDIVWGHNGGDQGVSSDILVSKENQIGIGLITNGDDYAGGLKQELYQWAKQQPETGSGWPDCTTSVNKESAPPIVEVYPNPTRDVLYIEISDLEGKVTASLNSNDGKLVYQKEANNTTQLKLDLSKVQLGVYFLTLQWGDNKRIEKVMKL